MKSGSTSKLTLWRFVRAAFLGVFVFAALCVIWIDSNLPTSPLPEQGKEMRDEFIVFAQQNRKLSSTADASVTNIAEKYIKPGDDVLFAKEFLEKNDFGVSLSKEYEVDNVNSRFVYASYPLVKDWDHILAIRSIGVTLEINDSGKVTKVIGRFRYKTL